MTQSSLHHDKFITTLLNGGDVYTIYDDNGIPAPVGDRGKRSIPFWCSENMAQNIIDNVPAYKGMKTRKIINSDFVGKWLSSLKSDELNIGCNWSGKMAKGYDCSPESIQEILSTRKTAQQVDAPEPPSAAR